MAPSIAPAISITTNVQNKKIIFDDDGEELTADAFNDVKGAKKGKKKKLKEVNKDEDIFKLDKGSTPLAESADEENDYFAKREKKRQQKKDDNDADTHKKWFNVYSEYTTSEEFLDMKDSEQMELYNVCKKAFEAEKSSFAKRDASDSRWLQTALHKGTAKDRANAGALLVTSNPLGNLEALNTLIGFTKLSNKSSNDVVTILVDLWKKVLLPPHRKLVSLQMRGADWKSLRKDNTLNKDHQRRIYAYWHFENELKELYFEFLRILQQAIQTGQDHNKNVGIVAASQLLCFAPEKEQMILTLLINKLGDPTPKVASKALHHLTEVAHRHPNMCGVIVAESEKLLFRNNICERAQHFALCFLASVAPSGRSEVCTKLVNICFSLFKVLVQKGAVNNRTMQAILRCLQKAILEAKPAADSTEILSKDMQDTIYRLVHLADIHVSVQTLGLLLQLITVKTEKSDRFYNALYKKMHDLEVVNVGVKTAAQLLHIIHRAIHIDANVERSQAFIKRLLQCALYLPANFSAGCLIVIHKLIRSRKELAGNISPYGNNENPINDGTTVPKVQATDVELSKFDSDGEEKYEDIHDEEESANEVVNEKSNELEESKIKPSTASSWHHAKLGSSAPHSKVKDMAPSKYDPYHRVPSFAGAEFALRDELLLLREHYHPTIQVFADNILQQKRIDYYGDPLRDFGLSHFLERFAFKNPKKLDNKKEETPTITHKRYVAFGTRGKPVKSLTKANCTEDEIYIFNFLEQKRQQANSHKTKKADKENEQDDYLKEGEIGDDEFEEYLGSYFGKKAKAAADAEDGEEEELDFLKELGGELKPESKKNKKKASKDDDEDAVEDIDADWGDDNLEEGDFAGDNDVSDDDDGSIDENFDGDEDDDAGSISLDEEDAPADLSDVDEESMSEGLSDQDEDDEEDDDDSVLGSSDIKKSRKRTVAFNTKSFAKKLKHSDDMSSLFAAADDFAELLEETGRTKGQGTSHALSNKDKSSAKQMKWEEKRHSNSKSYTKRSKNGNPGQWSTNKKRK